MEEWFDSRRVRRLRDRRHPLARAPTRTSCGWSCPSSSVAAVFRDRYTGPTLRENLGLDAARVARSMADDRAPAATGCASIEAATLVAGPMVATTLGEFGAEVIKVEQPGSGDPMRTWGDRKDGIGLVWKSVSRNKRCVTLDLRQPEGQELLPPAARRQRRARSWATDRARSSAGASTTSRCTPATRSIVMLHVSGYGARRAEQRPSRLRHPRRGHERVRPGRGPARRPADAAAVHAGRRRGRPGRRRGR